MQQLPKYVTLAQRQLKCRCATTHAMRNRMPKKNPCALQVLPSHGSYWKHYRPKEHLTSWQSTPCPRTQVQIKAATCFVKVKANGQVKYLTFHSGARKSHMFSSQWLKHQHPFLVRIDLMQSSHSVAFATLFREPWPLEGVVPAMMIQKADIFLS